MPPGTFEQFCNKVLRRGCDEALVRERAPGHETPVHEHPVDTRALVVRGECMPSLSAGSQGRTSAMP